MTCLLISGIVGSGCGEDPAGEFGPPAGWARVEGKVTRADKTPVVDAIVSIHCNEPGGLDTTHTDKRGDFGLWSPLPTALFAINPDTVGNVSCRVLVLYAPYPSVEQPVEVRYVGKKSQAIAKRLEFVIP